eukprot:TRINITY_DN15549_c0_g1_i1.p1 TRINITY_DN15549_c0_g1~~TRINITY_DN15549_c0_g1_i1.p1  ORF type:complete len:180 (-),score=4.86 TRINITY_DN15549_c0_g1_i1:80-619(-)
MWKKLLDWFCILFPIYIFLLLIYSIVFLVIISIYGPSWLLYSFFILNPFESLLVLVYFLRFFEETSLLPKKRVNLINNIIYCFCCVLGAPTTYQLFYGIGYLIGSIFLLDFSNQTIFQIIMVIYGLNFVIILIMVFYYIKLPLKQLHFQSYVNSRITNKSQPLLLNSQPVVRELGGNPI